MGGEGPHPPRRHVPAGRRQGLRGDAAGFRRRESFSYALSRIHARIDAIELQRVAALAGRRHGGVFGNSTLGEKESKTGTIDPGHLYLLQQSKLIPIETLLEVDHQSPFYNESNRASVFYAESWALVHYLLMDKEARQNQLLKNFLETWQKSGSQVQAAQTAFGDLKRFGQRIEARSEERRVGKEVCTEW